MAITVGTPDFWRLPQARGVKLCVVELTFDSSYPTGGEALTPAMVNGFEGDIDWLICIGDSGGYVFDWDNTNGKIKAYWADYDAVADGALVEVADTTDLSGVSPRFLVCGY